MKTLAFSTIPPRPEGPINPAEQPVAATLLASMPWHLLTADQLPPFYYWLSGNFPNLREEIWDLLFGQVPTPEATCSVLAFRPAAERFMELA